MPSIPRIANVKTNSSVEVLNAIRNSATMNYRDHVPIATPDAESVKKIGAIIMDYPALQNEFLNALINRIGLVMVTSKMYTNPLAILKKGQLEFGETVEEIFVNIAKPFQYNPEGSPATVLARNVPDVRSAFHVMNYQHFYKQTVERYTLEKAFLSWNGVDELIRGVIDAMYTGAAYDEFQVTKYMLARQLLDGHIYPVEIDADAPKSIVATIKGTSNAMTFANTKYNIAGVTNFSNKNDQYILLNSAFDATMDVEVLASAFNMNKAEFMGKRILVDSFGAIDNDRLDELFDDDETYVELTDDELAALDAIPAVLVDKDFFMIFDNLNLITNMDNGEGLYWNYWYHVWKTFSVSPFAQAVAFVPDTSSPSITSVVFTTDTGLIAAVSGSKYNIPAPVVTAAGFAPKGVTYSVTTGDTYATVDKNGTVTLKDAVEDLLAAGTVVVTATSIYDTTKSDTFTLTILIEED